VKGGGIPKKRRMILPRFLAQFASVKNKPKISIKGEKYEKVVCSVFTVNGF